MIKSILLRRILIFVFCVILLAALLIFVIYTVTVRRSYAAIRAEELIPRAESIAYLTALHKEGAIDGLRFQQFVSSSIADSYVVIFDYTGGADCQGSVFAYSENIPQGLRENSLKLLQPFLSRIIAGEKVVLPGGFAQDPDYILVGVPVLSAMGNESIGAVALLTPFTEVTPAIDSLVNTLFIAICVVIAIVLIPIIIVSNQLARPIRQMHDVALAMAGGNFSARANEKPGGEIGELGQSLNYLSATLDHTITELRMEKHRLMQMIDGLDEGIIAIDIDYIVTHANPTLLDIFGTHSPKSRLLSDIIPNQKVMQSFKDVVQQDAAQSFDLTLNTRSIRISISPLHSGKGSVVGAVGLFLDVTDEALLEQTRREYVANVSHELRTPLTSIRGFVEPLKDNLIPSDDQKARYYDYILRETLRLSRLIDDLLELSRLQSDNVAFTSKPFHLTELLLNLSQRYYTLADDSGVTFLLDNSAKQPLMAYGNPDRVEQVLIILLDNAIKYSPEDSLITLGVDVGEKIKVWVKDTGGGIAKEDLPHVFERFYKADKSRSKEGSGLGLSIAREVMHKMGESIGVYNTDKGSCFYFTLSIAASHGQGETGLLDK